MFDSRTLSKETLSRWTGRRTSRLHACYHCRVGRGRLLIIISVIAFTSISSLCITTTIIMHSIVIITSIVQAGRLLLPVSCITITITTIIVYYYTYYQQYRVLLYLLLVSCITITWRLLDTIPYTISMLYYTIYHCYQRLLEVHFAFARAPPSSLGGPGIFEA